MKNLTILLALITMLITAIQLPAQPQPPDTLWTRTYGGNDYDEGYSVQQTDDGGYIVVGSTKSFGANEDDVYLIKTDSYGDTIWTHTYGTGNNNRGYCVQQTIDGGYIVVGETSGSTDVYLLKTDQFGNEEWYQTIGGSEADIGNSVIQTIDGGFIIAGKTNSYGNGSYDVYLIKTDEYGDTLWTKTFGGTDWDAGCCVQQSVDSGFIITGFTYSFGAGGQDVYLIKTDSSGNEEWIQTFGGYNSDKGESVLQTTDGGYAIVGYTSTYGVGEADVYLIKTDSMGNEEWFQTFGGINTDVGYDIKLTLDGGFIIAGFTTSFGVGENDVYLIKVDSVGNEEWQTTFGGNDWDDARCIQQTNDAGYIVCGYTQSFSAGEFDVWLLKIAPDVPVIQVEPNICDFGILEVGYPENKLSEVTNIGSYELIISEFLISPPFSCQIISGDSTLSYGDTTTLEITFDPPEVGYYVDSLGIVSNATNQDTAWVHLEGEGGIIPAPVTGLTIETQGLNAVLNWNPVDTTIHGNPITVDTYIIFYSEIPYAPDSLYFYLWNTPETTFTHIDAAFFADEMFYQVAAYVGQIGELDLNPAFRMSDYKVILKENFR